MNLPRTFVGIPRAFGVRALNEFKGTDSGSRELYFDEDSDGIFTMTTEPSSFVERNPSMDDESISSDTSEHDEEIWC